jgi:hypothetical protein
LYEPPGTQQHHGNTSGHPRGQAETLGRGIDWKVTGTIGLPGKEASLPGLGKMLACREQEIGPGRTT